ncbi:MAG: hypothetical protein ACRDKI_09960 [Solirubrobacterales bacterium]
MLDTSSDIRRYSWCRGHALWIVGLPTAAALEDLRGAIGSDNPGVGWYAARTVGECCAIAADLVLNQSRPLPPAALRSAVAMERLETTDESLAKACWQLISGVDTTLEAAYERAQALVAEIVLLTGDTPNILSPEGYFPAIAMARDWYRLMDAIGEESILPTAWTEVE